jgi:hypothetical protein
VSVRLSTGSTFAIGVTRYRGFGFAAVIARSIVFATCSGLPARKLS